MSKRSELSPEELKALRDADKERKKKSRDEKRDKQSRAEGKGPAYIPTTTWWESNRRRDLTKAQLEELAARESKVLDTCHWARAYIAGTYNVDPSETDFYVSLEDGVEEMRDDIAKYDIVRWPAASAAQWLRTDPDFVDTVRRSGRNYLGFQINASEILLRYGFLVAIPSDISCHPILLIALKRPIYCGSCRKGLGESKSVDTVYCDECTKQRADRTAAAYANYLGKAINLKAHDDRNKVYGGALDGWGRPHE